MPRRATALGVAPLMLCLMGVPAQAAEVVLRGSVLAAAGWTSREQVRVEVPGVPALGAPVSAGSFSLQGLPEGSFTLLFRRGKTAVGELPFATVLPGQRIDIVVELGERSVRLRDEQRRGGAEPVPCFLGSPRPGDTVVLDGAVTAGSAGLFHLAVGEALVEVSGAGASFACEPSQGPGATGPELCRASITAGASVHVTGNLRSCSRAAAQVLATQVEVAR